MRKILLSLAALLTAGVAWAQTVVTAIDTEKYYTLECRSGAAHSTSRFIGDNGTVINGQSSTASYFVFEEAEAENSYYIKSYKTGKYINHNGTNISASTEKTTAWTFGVGGKNNVAGVVTFTIGNDKYLNNNGSDCADGTCSSLKANYHQGGPASGNACSLWEMCEYDTPYEEVTVKYSFKYNGREVAIQSVVVLENSDYPEITEAFPYGITGSKPDGKVSADDAVEGVVTKEITLSKTAELPFKVYADYNSVERWYYLNIRDTDPTYLKYEEGVNYIKTTDNMAAVEASEDKDAYTWAFIGDANDPFAGFQMVNYKTGATMVLSAPAAPNENKNANQLARMVTKEGALGNTAWVIKNTTHEKAASGAFYVEHPTAKAWAFNRQDYDHDGDGNAEGSTAKIRTLCYWNGRDTGSALQVVERPMNAASELRLLIEDAEDLFAVVNTGKTAVGYYTLESVEVLKNAIETAKSVSAATDADVETLQAAMDALETIQPEEGKFYTIQNSYSNIYMSVGNTSGMVSSEAAGFAQVFQFVSAEDGNFYLFNVERGTYLNTNKAHQQGQEFASAIVTGDAKPVKIVNLGAENHVSITPIGGATLHHDAGQGTIVAWNGGLNSRSSWKIVEVDMSAMSHSVVIAESGWATLVLGCNAVIPADVKAYVVSATSETSAALTEITGTIPANEAVLLNAAEGTYEFKYAADATPVAKNLLEGTVFDANVNGEAYVLASPTVEDVAQPVGFYKAKLTISTNTENDGEEGATDDTFEAFKNNAFKAYLPAPAASARFLSFDFGTETAIDELKGENGNVKTAIYDLSGRRVQKAQKGLYIVNGVKVIK